MMCCASSEVAFEAPCSRAHLVTMVFCIHAWISAEKRFCLNIYRSYCTWVFGEQRFVRLLHRRDTLLSAGTKPVEKFSSVTLDSYKSENPFCQQVPKRLRKSAALLWTLVQTRFLSISKCQNSCEIQQRCVWLLYRRDSFLSAGTKAVEKFKSVCFSPMQTRFLSISRYQNSREIQLLNRILAEDFGPIAHPYKLWIAWTL